MVIAIPSASTVPGVARTSREGDRDDQPVRAGRSITLRNGACPNYLPNVATTNAATVDPPTTTYSLADMARDADGALRAQIAVTVCTLHRNWRVRGPHNR